jgi:hypothetical protein
MFSLPTLLRESETSTPQSRQRSPLPIAPHSQPSDSEVAVAGTFRRISLAYISPQFIENQAKMVHVVAVRTSVL